MSRPETLPVRVVADDDSTAAMLQRLMELKLPLAVTLGNANMPLQEVIKLTSGSIVELDRLAGDYVDLTIHGTIVARGEIVAVKGNYGVRLKEIISRQERLALPEAA